MVTRKQVMLILKEYEHSNGATVDEICTAISRKLNVDMDSMIKPKVISILIDCLEQDIVTEENGRFNIIKEADTQNMNTHMETYSDFTIKMTPNISSPHAALSMSNISNQSESERISVTTIFPFNMKDDMCLPEGESSQNVPRKQRKQIKMRRDITLDEAFRVIKRIVRENKRKFEMIKRCERRRIQRVPQQRNQRNVTSKLPKLKGVRKRTLQNNKVVKKNTPNKRESRLNTSRKSKIDSEHNTDKTVCSEDNNTDQQTKTIKVDNELKTNDTKRKKVHFKENLSTCDKEK